MGEHGDDTSLFAHRADTALTPMPGRDREGGCSSLAPIFFLAQNNIKRRHNLLLIIGLRMALHVFDVRVVVVVQKGS
jgi:hypothetical protein